MFQKSILIVEDEPVVAQDLADMILEMGFEVFGKASSASKAIKLLDSAVKPDLAILDISIKGDMDGIALAKIINTHYKVPFIFLTSFANESTVNRALPVNPAAYLLKPFDFEELSIHIRLALFKTVETPKAEPISELFFIKHKQQLMKLNQEDILWAEADDNYTFIFTNTDKYLQTKSLKEVEEKLLSAVFIRVHRSYIINSKKITAISEDFVHINQHKIPIGKQYKQNLFAAITLI
ncbi:MAG: response regulator [Bacteroidota bacterium]|nr:response regulator [Bacteroidota bacterium]